MEVIHPQKRVALDLRKEMPQKMGKIRNLLPKNLMLHAIVRERKRDTKDWLEKI